MKKIIFILGYGQNTRKTAGLYKIANKIPHNGNQCQITIYPWRVSPIDLADSLTNDTMLVGFSYGGYTATQIARYSVPLGKRIKYLMLVDPVWRPKNSRASFKSINNDKKIILSPNIDTAYVWRQRVGLIKGNKVIPDKETVMYESILRVRHIKMDSHPAIIKPILDAAADFITN